jgi:hypothetical protein
MKITKAILLSAAIITSACSDDDDDKKSNLENAKLSFAGKNAAVKAPQGLQNSDDQHAQMANAWLGVANGMTEFVAFFELPESAKKSGTHITAANGRTKATGDVLTYTWIDEESGLTVGYQVSEAADEYHWEIFVNHEGEWIRYIDARESKDGNAGALKVSDIFDGDPNDLLLHYEWSRSNDVLTLVFSSPVEQYQLAISIHETTGAGSVTSYENSVKNYEIIWDQNGDGSWIYFEDGEAKESGAWGLD